MKCIYYECDGKYETETLSRSVYANGDYAWITINAQMCDTCDRLLYNNDLASQIRDAIINIEQGVDQ